MRVFCTQRINGIRCQHLAVKFYAVEVEGKTRFSGLCESCVKSNKKDIKYIDKNDLCPFCNFGQTKWVHIAGGKCFRCNGRGISNSITVD
jgi:hypothetical protein